MKPWFERQPESLEREERAVAAAYPNLYFVIGDGSARVRGSLPVQVGAVVVDRFQVELLLARDHPATFPLAWEIGGRVPRLNENHVSDDGQLCLFLPEEGSDCWSAGSTVVSFLQGPVNSFFVGYLHYLAHGSWPFGERRHGLDGILDFYRERTEISELEGLLGAMKLLAKGGVKGHWKCPCGSRQKIRTCHRGILTLREAVSPTVVATSLRRIADEVKKSAASRPMPQGPP